MFRDERLLSAGVWCFSYRNGYSFSYVSLWKITFCENATERKHGGESLSMSSGENSLTEK